MESLSKLYFSEYYLFMLEYQNPWAWHWPCFSHNLTEDFVELSWNLRNSEDPCKHSRTSGSYAHFYPIHYDFKPVLLKNCSELEISYLPRFSQTPGWRTQDRPHFKGLWQVIDVQGTNFCSTWLQSQGSNLDPALPLPCPGFNNLL